MPNLVHAALSAMLTVVLGSIGAAHAQDLRATKHNLSGRDDLSGTEAGQICVFCHTPSIASSATAVIEPQWQKHVSTTFSFPLYDDIGRMGMEGNSAVGSQSIACLSCHDSVQAFSVSRLTSVDHPFGIPYRGALDEQSRSRARAAARRSGAPMHEASRVISDEFRPAQRSVIDNRPVWWASRHAGVDRRGRDDLPLFVRRDVDDGSEIPFVECASCHNPHSNQDLFLRITPSGGVLCQTCHVK